MTYRQVVISASAARLYRILLSAMHRCFVASLAVAAALGCCPSTHCLAASLVASRFQAGALWTPLDWRSVGRHDTEELVALSNISILSAAAAATAAAMNSSHCLLNLFVI